MTIKVVDTKGRGVINLSDSPYKQWVTEYKLATVVNGQIIYYKGPLEDGKV